MGDGLIVVTGAAGFIACNLARRLNASGFTNLVLVDDFSKTNREINHQNITCLHRIDRNVFFDWAKGQNIGIVYHLGARTDTTEFNFGILEELNLDYSKKMWALCVEKQIPLIYASSAATYGMGDHGFEDDESKIPLLKPLNPYGLSKQLFDEFVLVQTVTPPNWYGLKFFNVYGPYEQHKGRMASVIYHAFLQINERHSMLLFKSHHPDFEDGGQMRDFIFVDDVVEVCCFLGERKPKNGIYNVGTGNASTFKDLALGVFAALELPPYIEYIPTPEDIRDKYQYFTEATMGKLIAQGYTKPFTSLESGISKYVGDLMK